MGQSSSWEVRNLGVEVVLAAPCECRGPRAPGRDGDICVLGTVPR